MKKTMMILLVLFVAILGGTYRAYGYLLQGVGTAPYIAPYPNVLSPRLDNLPQGCITIIVGDETYYYFKGTFYQKVEREQAYVAVPPPIGAVVFSLPEGYQMMLIDGVSYYEYNNVYYRRVLDGYKVTPPPV